MHFDKMHTFLLSAAGSTPDKPAVIEQGENDGLRVVTYRQLENQVDDYRAALAELGLNAGDRVVIESDNSGSAIAMLAACSALGLPFIPVSPETPSGRLQWILSSAEPALHVQTPAGRREGIPGHIGTGRFGPAGLDVERRPAARPRLSREAITTDPAYIIFTSGTTGRPKGVVMSHRGVLSFYRGMLRRGIVTPDDRVATTSPLQFDFSLLDIGLALGSGATIMPVPRASLRWPRKFLRFLRDTRATQVDGVPSIWRPVLRHEPEELAGLDQLRGILFSGEEFPLAELRRLRSLLPELRVVNCYGPTEVMAASLTYVPDPIPDDMERLSIGSGYPGSEMVLIDEAGASVEEPGAVGVIHLRTPSLFNGYWGDPELTRAALVPDPHDPRSGQVVFRTGDLAYRGPEGELYYCGRVDSQVQIRGNRVELGEVEHRMREFPGVAAAAALVVPRQGGDPVLNAFVVSAGALDKMKLRDFCSQTLPEYMVPQQLHVLDELPVTDNGKLDRVALAAQVTT
ncbi:AMP-binding protein [Streptosporangium sp. NBC_01756]|uniref:AMP-binding protein n=1 Tax=Streptosporangium sp. NBC_01756 TaxID=2975950 RepID=UPI002DD9F279|nr:AMP-binding protein [Streptosporangium sp. NBC_01756]WSC88656.1 AMP-binding protein [Streptosporangium sp. NBC_01756]